MNLKGFVGQKKLDELNKVRSFLFGEEDVDTLERNVLHKLNTNKGPDIINPGEENFKQSMNQVRDYMKMIGELNRQNIWKEDTFVENQQQRFKSRKSTL